MAFPISVKKHHWDFDRDYKSCLFLKKTWVFSSFSIALKSSIGRTPVESEREVGGFPTEVFLRASEGPAHTVTKSQPLCHLSTAGTERGQTRDSALGSRAADPGPEWVCDFRLRSLACGGCRGPVALPSHQQTTSAEHTDLAARAVCRSDLGHG